MSDERNEQYQAKWNEYQLGQLAGLAQQRVFQIPRFQRDFVWNEGQIKLLADSVARNYPIGSLLLLAENRTALELAGRPIDAIVADQDSGQDAADEDTRAPIARFHVLDGQQRLTSLVRVFANISPTRIYYVDLVKVLESFGPDRTEETDWLVARRRPKDPKFAQDRGRLIRTDVILDVKKASLYLDEFIDEVPTSELPEAFRGATDKEQRAKNREAKATLTEVFETIRNYRVPAIVIDRESPLSAICRIFETINSTGKRLTTFDLAVATFYPQPDLRELWDDTTRHLRRLRQYDIDGERILQLIVLKEANRERTTLAATRNAVLGLTKKRDLVRDQWSEAARAIDRALEWAEHQGARPPSLPHEPTIMSLACLYFTDGAEEWLRRTAGSRAQLERWYFSKILQAASRAASNYNIGRDYGDLRAWFREGTPLPVVRVNLSAADVAQLSPSDVRYKAIFSLMVREVKCDIRSQAILATVDQVEDHHVFPRSFKKIHGLSERKLESIANRLPISKDSNLQISNRPPQEYFEQILNSGARRSVVTVLERAGFGVIAESNEEFLATLSVSGFEKFIASRAERLLDMIQRVLNGALSRGTELEQEDP